MRAYLDLGRAKRGYLSEPLVPYRHSRTLLKLVFRPARFFVNGLPPAQLTPLLSLEHLLLLHRLADALAVLLGRWTQLEVIRKGEAADCETKPQAHTHSEQSPA